MNKELVVSMVPFADMLNHDIQKFQTKWFYDDARQGFCIQANDNIPRGDQIYLNYGAKSNANFLMSYGFLDESNKDNFAAINVPLDSDDSQHQMKSFICSKILEENPKSEYFLRETLDHEGSAKFISWIRMHVFEDQDT